MLIMPGAILLGAPLHVIHPATLLPENFFDFASDPISDVCFRLFGGETADL